jgi:hypothetical protein
LFLAAHAAALDMPRAALVEALRAAPGNALEPCWTAAMPPTERREIMMAARAGSRRKAVVVTTTDEEESWPSG